MNAKSLLPLLTALLIAPATVPLLPTAPVRAQTTTETDATALLEEGDRLLEQGTQQYQRNQFQEALQSFQSALEIYQNPEVQDASYWQARPGEGDALNNLGLTYTRLGQYPQAIRFFMEAINITHQFADTARRGEIFGNLGDVYYQSGMYSNAFDLYERQLEITRELGDRVGEGSALLRLGSAYVTPGLHEQGITLIEQSLKIFRELNYPTGEGAALSALGQAYNRLGQYSRAIELSEQSLDIFREIDNRYLEAEVFANLGSIYSTLGQVEQSIDLYGQGLSICSQVGDRQCESSISVNLGNIYLNLRQFEEAIPFYEESLTFSREIGDRTTEIAALRGLGNAHSNLHDYQQAAFLYFQAIDVIRNSPDVAGAVTLLGDASIFFQNQGYDQIALQALPIVLNAAREIGDQSNEGRYLNLVGDILIQREQPELAIVFYKQSVNVRESIRGELVNLSQEVQQSYTETIADDYRELADLLLQQNRILEAQEVLDLLKLQELQDYELRVRGTADTRLGLDLWEAEQAILDRFFSEVRANPAQFNFNAFISSPDIVANVQQLQQNARGQNLNPAQLARLQDNLQQAGNAALLYPLILDDRLELVLVTPDGLINETVPVDRLTLNAAIVSFRQDITDSFSDPRANGQQLYEWLMQPIVDDLDAAGVDTILYAADGALRYIPIAALHDGDQWLTERFTINHITAASLTDFTQQGANDLNILAGAFPEQDVYVDLGTEQVWFSGLPFAQEEVQNLVSSIPQTTAFFSQDFNRSAIETRLNDDYTIIHLATHAEFRSGHPTDSFILLGDGDRLTVADLNRWQLPDVDLVVLSACKTAVSSELGDGAEILGFGYQMQQTGADAAIASLWYVSDGGTQVLMDAFYTALDNGLSESEALRRSQQALITSDESVLAGDRGNTATIEIVDPRTGERLSNSPDLAHPYYWAPFILIGNGL